MFPGSDPSVDDGKKVSKMKKFSIGSHHNSTDLFSYLTAEYKKQPFKLRRKDLLTKGFTHVQNAAIVGTGRGKAGMVGCCSADGET